MTFVSSEVFTRMVEGLATEAPAPEVDPDDDGRNACACGWRRSPTPGAGLWHSTFKLWKPEAVCGPVEN